MICIPRSLLAWWCVAVEWRALKLCELRTQQTKKGKKKKKKFKRKEKSEIFVFMIA
jgi:hypothetical protein